MASSSAADADDDDLFPSYNPHPYAGGYDISAVYGSPLPPSDAICYPISSPVRNPSLPALDWTPPTEELGLPVPEREHELARQPQQHITPYAYDSPDVFRSYSTDEHYGDEYYGHDYWRQGMRGLDYLFGHAHGFGERLAGVDWHGIPVYACKESSSDKAVAVIEPALLELGTAEMSRSANHNAARYINSRQDAYSDTAYDAHIRYPDDHQYNMPSGMSWFHGLSYGSPYGDELSFCDDARYTNSREDAYCDPAYDAHVRYPYDQKYNMPSGMSMFCGLGFGTAYGDGFSLRDIAMILTIISITTYMNQHGMVSLKLWSQLGTIRIITGINVGKKSRKDLS